MLRLSEQKAPPAAFENWIEQRAKNDKVLLETQDTLTATYKNLRRLRAEERNHIWGYVARNLSRPVWLATTGQKVDAIIGNPPWLPYRAMSPDMQKSLRTECKERGLWAGGIVATQQDESAYFFARCAELYLKRNGTIAMVLPFATITRQQYQGLRTGVFASGLTRKKEVRIYASGAFYWSVDFR
jgi:methylase of polypeptide subunit release factors